MANDQAPNPNKIPNPKVQWQKGTRLLFGPLGLGHWSLIGIWDLVIGHLFLRPWSLGFKIGTISPPMSQPVTIENDFVRMEVYPHIGGKVASLIDKADKFEMMFDYPVELPTRAQY